MISTEKSNPFRILKLPTDATNKDIVAQGTELSDLSETDDQRLLYRSAIEELITHNLARLEYELFEIPDTRYDDLEWERFVRLHRRNPINLSAFADEVPPPGLKDFDFEALINLLLDSMLLVPEIDTKTAVINLPFEAGCGLPPLEVKDVIFG